MLVYNQAQRNSAKESMGDHVQEHAHQIICGGRLCLHLHMPDRPWLEWPVLMLFFRRFRTTIRYVSSIEHRDNDRR